jgi:hypothetical protein
VEAGDSVEELLALCVGDCGGLLDDEGRHVVVGDELREHLASVAGKSGESKAKQRRSGATGGDQESMR